MRQAARTGRWGKSNNPTKGSGALDGVACKSEVYASEKYTTKQTSLKIHIDIVRHGETQDVIKILKLWRHRHDIPLGLVVIELATGQALFSNRQNSLEDRVWNPGLINLGSWGSIRKVR